MRVGKGGWGVRRQYVAEGVEDGCGEGAVCLEHVAHQHVARPSLLRHVPHHLPEPVEERVVVRLFEADEKISHLQAPLDGEIRLP